MPWLPMYVNREDSGLLRSLLNEDRDIAFIVAAGKRKWKALPMMQSFQDGRYCIWHIPSGPLPLTGGFLGDGRVKDPWAGWKEKRTGADAAQPYFGAGHPGIIWLNLLTCSLGEPEKIGLSSFEWIGNRYSSIGHPAPAATKKWWEALRKSIARATVKLPREEGAGLKNEIYTFAGAAREIADGRERANNPDIIDYS